MSYAADDGNTYQLNLIDTPGHVDFSYEVSRSLSACEGALLVVDAAQGVEAQTVANAFLALENDLEIVPVRNKIDLPAARPEEIDEELHSTFGFQQKEALRCSARPGEGVREILEAVVTLVPAPEENLEGPLRALIFDSTLRRVSRSHRLRPHCGRLPSQRVGDLSLMATKARYVVDEVGIFTPTMTPKSELRCGQVGYIVANIKSLHEVKIGDTLTTHRDGTDSPLPGFQSPKPMVFCGIYPATNSDFRGAAQRPRPTDAQRQ